MPSLSKLSFPHLSPILQLNLAQMLFAISLAAMWAALAGFSFVWSSAVPLLGICLALAALAWFYTVHRPEPAFVLVFSWTAILIAYSAGGTMLSYLSAAMNFPTWDAAFANADRAVGFDWQAWLARAEQMPWLALIWKIFYPLSLPMVAVTVLYLGFTRRQDRLEEFMTCLTFSATLTVLIGGYFAALGPYVHYDVALAELSEYKATVLREDAAHGYVGILSGLRDGSLRVLSLGSTEGLIAFPSFHTVMSALMILAARRTVMFWPMVVINSLILSAVPIDGGHYLADVFAGFAMTAFIFVAYHKLIEPMAHGRLVYPAIIARAGASLQAAFAQVGSRASRVPQALRAFLSGFGTAQPEKK